MKIHSEAKEAKKAIETVTGGRITVTEAQAQRMLNLMLKAGYHVVGPHPGKCLIFSASINPRFTTKEDLREQFEDAIDDLRLRDRQCDDDDDRVDWFGYIR